MMSVDVRDWALGEMEMAIPLNSLRMRGALGPLADGIELPG